MDDNGDDFRSYFQKFVILRVVQQIFCEILIGEIETVYTDSFFEVANIRNNMQNDSSDFEGLLQEMMPKEPFINE